MKRESGDSGSGGSGPSGQAAASTAAAPLRLASPVDVVVAVPYLLGFHPRDSLVLVSIGGCRVSLATRIDLPPPSRTRIVSSQLAATVAGHGCDEVLLVVVGGGVSGPRRTDLVAATRAAFDALGVMVSAAIWVPEVAAGATWRCWDVDTGRWDPDGGGVLPDPSTSPVAAATVAAGQVTFPGRADLERLVAPADQADLDRRSRLLDAHCDRQSRLAEPADPDSGADAFALLRAWVERADSTDLRLGDDHIVELCVALSDPMVRDAAFGFAEGPHSAAAERLWSALARESPAPEAAEPAVLLAHCALVRGNGALVGIALERAGTAWPGHRMGELFQAAVDGGLGPDELRGWFAEGAAEARLLLRRRNGR